MKDIIRKQIRRILADLDNMRELAVEEDWVQFEGGIALAEQAVIDARAALEDEV